MIVDYFVGHTGSVHDSWAFWSTRTFKEHNSIFAPGEWMWADSAYPSEILILGLKLWPSRKTSVSSGAFLNKSSGQTYSVVCNDTHIIPIATYAPVPLIFSISIDWRVIYNQWAIISVIVTSALNELVLQLRDPGLVPTGQWKGWS
jgi:hypothetical protein